MEVFMEKQTENYIVLKPIAERFNMVAKEISDDDIKYIIKEAMKEQIKGVFDFSRLEDLTYDIITDNEESIKEMITESISNGLRFK
jgi:glyceraldehyde-3-phosphate dehydrogenase/erythrose-4-phosphate dehydrogenase